MMNLSTWITWRSGRNGLQKSRKNSPQGLHTQSHPPFLSSSKKSSCPPQPSQRKRRLALISPWIFAKTSSLVTANRRKNRANTSWTTGLSCCTFVGTGYRRKTGSAGNLITPIQTTGRILPCISNLTVIKTM